MTRIQPTQTQLFTLLLSLLVLAAVACGPGEGSEPAGTSDSAAEAHEADSGKADPAAEEAAPSEPRVAPEFTLADLAGEVVRSADLRGKTVVIDFWATWCPPCEFQVPELNEFQKSHAATGDVVVLGISVDIDTDDVVRDWAQMKGVEYRVLLGGEELARRFGAVGFPTLYVLAPDGRVAMEHVGLIKVADLEGALDELRAGS